ncbi:MAG: hypothetical protein C0453_17720 [Comamonadaceae bacterium]|nr:hypothetical protein [Comamonadaceae bacterium]
MTHPRRASRDPLKGAIPVARQSRFHGISGLEALRSGRGINSAALRAASLWQGRLMRRGVSALSETPLACPKAGSD